MRPLAYRWFAPALLAALALSAGGSVAMAKSRTSTRTQVSESKVTAGSTAHDGWMGVYLDNLGQITRSALGLADDEGVAITGTVKSGPAAAAGLKRGDVILRVGGVKVGSESDLREQLRGRAGQALKVDVMRAARTQSFDVKLADKVDQDGSNDEDSYVYAPDAPDAPDVPDAPDAPDAPEAPEMEGFPRDITIMTGGGAFLGVEPQDLNRELGESFGVPDGRGVLLARIVPGGPAEKAGMKAGDVLVGFEGERLESASDLRRHLRKVDSRKSVVLEVMRKQERRKFTVELNGSAQRRTSRITIPDMSRLRWNLDSSRDQLRSEVRDLRDQLKELRTQLKDMMEREKR